MVCSLVGGFPAFLVKLIGESGAWLPAYRIGWLLGWFPAFLARWFVFFWFPAFLVAFPWLSLHVLAFLCFLSFSSSFRVFLAFDIACKVCFLHFCLLLFTFRMVSYGFPMVPYGFLVVFLRLPMDFLSLS